MSKRDDLHSSLRRTLEKDGWTMDHTLNYSDILKQTVQTATTNQPRLQAIKLYPVCDTDSGHFLVLATGWDKQRWIDTILFHARLVENQVIIEEDNFEAGLTSALIAAGIKQEDIVTSLRQAVTS